MASLYSTLQQAYQTGNYALILTIFNHEDQMISRYSEEGEDLSPFFLSLIRDFGRTGNVQLISLLNAIPDEFVEDHIYEQDEVFLEGLKQGSVDSIPGKLELFFARTVDKKYHMQHWDGKAFLKFLPSALKNRFKALVNY